MDKLYKTVLAAVTAASVLVCSACAGAPAADQVQDPDAGKTLPEMTEKITIPASIFMFRPVRDIFGSRTGLADGELSGRAGRDLSAHGRV